LSENPGNLFEITGVAINLETQSRRVRHKINFLTENNVAAGFHAFNQALRLAIEDGSIRPLPVSDWSNPSGSTFSSGTEVQINVAERYRRLIVRPLHLRKSSQALCSTCPILRHPRRFPHARSVPLPQTTIFGFDEPALQSVWSSAWNTKADQETRETVDRKASIRTCKAADLSE
jgi:hypothetical protein